MDGVWKPVFVCVQNSPPKTVLYLDSGIRHSRTRHKASNKACKCKQSPEQMPTWTEFIVIGCTFTPPKKNGNRTADSVIFILDLTKIWNISIARRDKRPWSHRGLCKLTQWIGGPVTSCETSFKRPRPRDLTSLASFSNILVPSHVACSNTH